MSNILQYNFFQRKAASSQARNIPICPFSDDGMHFIFIISMPFLSGLLPWVGGAISQHKNRQLKNFSSMLFTWNRYCQALEGHIFLRRSSLFIKACSAEAPRSHTHTKQRDQNFKSLKIPFQLQGLSTVDTQLQSFRLQSDLT